MDLATSKRRDDSARAGGKIERWEKCLPSRLGLKLKAISKSNNKIMHSVECTMSNVDTFLRPKICLRSYVMFMIQFDVLFPKHKFSSNIFENGL